jgi:hypothetical protein
LPDGAMPMVPAVAGPRSERMSPKRLEATITSNPEDTTRLLELEKGCGINIGNPG